MAVRIKVWGDMVTCAVVTLQAGPNLEPIHDREPLILNPDQWPLWLGEAGHGAARLMQPTPAGALRAYRVSRAVNSNRAEGPQLIEDCVD